MDRAADPVRAGLKCRELYTATEVQVPGGALAVPAASKGRRLRAKALQGGSDGCQEPVPCSGRWVGEWPWALGLNKGCAAGRVQRACPVIRQGPGPRSSCLPTPRNKRAARRMCFLRKISSQSGTDAPAASRTLGGPRAGHRLPAPSEAGPRLWTATTLPPSVCKNGLNVIRTQGSCLPIEKPWLWLWHRNHSTEAQGGQPGQAVPCPVQADGHGEAWVLVARAGTSCAVLTGARVSASQCAGRGPG